MKKFKIIIFGSSGMLGNQVIKCFLKDKRFKVYEMNRKKRGKSIKINLEKKKQLIEKINLIKPDYVVGVLVGLNKRKQIK